MQTFTLSQKIRKTRKTQQDVTEKLQSRLSDRQRKNNRKEKQQSKYNHLTGDSY